MEQIKKILINGKEYEIKGDSVFIRYSANADGTDFTERWSEGQCYVGFASGLEAPTDKSDYTWMSSDGDLALERAMNASSSIFSNASKSKISSEVVRVEDASPVPHKVKVKFSGNAPKKLSITDKIVPYGWSKTPITVDGNNVILHSATGRHGFEIDGSILEFGKTYTFSVGYVSDCNRNSHGWRLRYTDNTYSRSLATTPSLVETITITKEVDVIQFMVGSPYDTDQDIEVKAVQIEEGSVANRYRFCPSKNLIPFPYWFESGKTVRGVTATIQDDGGICLNGTATEDAFFKLSVCRIGYENITSLTAYDHTNSVKFVHNNDTGRNDRTVHQMRWWTYYSKETGAISLCAKKGCTFNNEVAYPQIELGQVTTAYEKGSPYYSIDVDKDGCGEFISPSTKFTVWAEQEDVQVDVEYHTDLNVELAKLKPNARLEEYGLPILYIEGDTYGMSKNTECALAYKYGDRQGTCSMKWQGSSSIKWSKKNYTIKFDTAFEAKEGWGEQKKYCLKANYVDASHARNIIGARIWADFVKSRTTKNERLEALANCGAVDGFPIIMVLNGEFHGLYTFNIPKDKWMMGMGDGSSEAILCAEGVNGGNSTTTFKALANLDGNDFSVEYAPDEDDTEWIKTSINRLIKAVMDSDGTDIDTTIAQYLDIDSAIDYILFVVFIFGFDNLHRNYLLSTYDGTKWFFTQYDMDSTFGLETGLTGDPCAPYRMSFSQVKSISYLAKLLCKHKKQEIIDRYRQLRQVGYPLSDTAPMMTAIDFISEIPQGVYAKDFDKWRGIRLTSTNNYAQLAEFMGKRLKFMDDTIDTI